MNEWMGEQKLNEWKSCGDLTLFFWIGHSGIKLFLKNIGLYIKSVGILIHGFLPDQFGTGINCVVAPKLLVNIE